MLGAELARGIVMATGAIVLAVAFGATIKPIADGSVGALDAIKFMAVAIVPMLQYALPFGACMAATLGYHRFASENEAIAASAGGISYGSMIAPALVAGVVLLASLLALTGLVAPKFTRVLESIVTKDAARTIVRQIERGESVVIDDVILHADRAFQVGADPSTGALDYFILEGVVAAAVDGETGTLSADVATQRADVWLYPAERDGEEVVAVYMLVTGGLAKQEGETLIRLRRTEFGPWIIPGALGDDLDYMTDAQLAAVAADPELYRPVTQRRDEVAAALARARARSEIAETVRGQASLTLVDPEGGRLAVNDAALASGARDRLRLVPREGADSIELTWRRADGSLRQLAAAKADLDVGVTVRERVSRITIALTDVASTGALEGRRDEVTLSESFGLTIDPAPEAFGLNALQLLEIAEASEDEDVTASGERLAKKYRDVRWEAIANRHERAALSVASLIMTPLGAIMALRLRDRIALHVYLWSFFPALACVVIASGGSSVAQEHGASGLYLMWTGCVAFGVFAVFEFLRLRHH